MTVIRKARILLKTFNFKHNFEEHLNHYARLGRAQRTFAETIR